MPVFGVLFHEMDGIIASIQDYGRYGKRGAKYYVGIFDCKQYAGQSGNDQARAGVFVVFLLDGLFVCLYFQ